MTIIKKSLSFALSVGLTLVGTSAFGAAIVTVTVNSGGKLFTNHVGAALSGGTLGVNGDGDVLQIGYFSSATAATPFSGSWIALTGNGGANSAFNTTSVGDGVSSGAGNRAAFSVIFDATDSTKNQSLPLAGTPLGVRIYDGFTLATSSFFETIVSPDWAFIPPADPPLNPTIVMNFTNANAKLASTNAAPGATIQTNTPTAAPEPASATLLMVGLVSLAARRRRAAKV